MMDGMAGYAFTVFVITLTGVLPPGPMMAITVTRGAANPHAGAWVAAGHALVELPLMAAVYFGAGLAFRHLPVRAGIGALGGMALLYMAVMLLRAAESPTLQAPTSRRPLLAGALVSASNPFFWVWWATAGAAMLSQSIVFGAIGFAVAVVIHLCCDFGWYWFLSGVSFRGREFFGPRLTQSVNLLAALALFYFGSNFLVGAGLLWGW